MRYGKHPYFTPRSIQDAKDRKEELEKATIAYLTRKVTAPKRILHTS